MDKRPKQTPYQKRYTKDVTFAKKMANKRYSIS